MFSFLKFIKGISIFGISFPIDLIGIGSNCYIFINFTLLSFFINYILFTYRIISNFLGYYYLIGIYIY